MKGKTFRFFFTFSKVLLLIKGKTFRLLKQKNWRNFTFSSFYFLCVWVLIQIGCIQYISCFFFDDVFFPVFIERRTTNHCGY